MFDVSWPDPTRETVGQRKARKEQARNSDKLSQVGSQVSDRDGSMWSSRSRESSPSQLKPSFFNIFGPSYRKPAPKKGEVQAQFKIAPPPLQIENFTKQHSISHCTPNLIAQGLPGEALDSRLVRASCIGNVYTLDAENSSFEVSESIFSEHTGRSVKTTSTWSSGVDSITYLNPARIVQPSSPTSSTTQCTEITVSPRGSLQSAEQVATIVHISSIGTFPVKVYDSVSKRCAPIGNLKFPMPGDNQTPMDHASKPEEESLQADGCRVSSRHSWYPPDLWGFPDERAEPSIFLQPMSVDLPIRLKKSKRVGAITKRSKIPTVEMTQLQKTIRCMEAASDRIVLERLKEEWVEVADASVYRELELEKQLWMLTALRKRSRDQIQEISEPATGKILSLFENRASCTSLSALFFPSQIHHLSTSSPLSPKSWPNVHSLTIPSPSSQLPYPSEIFTCIHAFSLPTSLPASLIPSMLKECHRTLVSAPSPASCDIPISPPTSTSNVTIQAGILHLTILDPLPLLSTLGPLLQQWLESNLIRNLEKQFRCTSPGEHFPVWLADAGLRGAGSTILPIQFLACHSPPENLTSVSRLLGEVVPGDLVETGRSDCAKEELKSVVGRMLWKDIWGPYVQAERWWYEDDDIVEECQRMRTTWECAIIQAVKQDCG